MLYGVDLAKKIKKSSIHTFFLERYCREDSWFTIKLYNNSDLILTVGDFVNGLVQEPKQSFLIELKGSKASIIKEVSISDYFSLKMLS